jgi:glutamate-1-semialdehyde 2,1-aminomutase
MFHIGFPGQVVRYLSFGFSVKTLYNASNPNAQRNRGLFRMKNDLSKRAFDRACRVIPGGVNSPVRAFGGVDLPPVFIDRAAGSHIWDIDGNRYIDYVGSWGPMILGHAHPAAVEAVCRAVEKGASFGAATEAETLLAERITAAFASIEKIRLLSSGTEAVMTALRLARAYTKRDLIVKMIGCYHGHIDSMLVQAGSGAAELACPSSAGIPAAFAEKTLTVPYNDADSAAQLFQKYNGRIAAVIIEPVAANMGVVPPAEGYLYRLRQLCDEQKSILIFDEVITGFRAAYGGAQSLYNIRADLTCLGKIVGGGLPCAAVGGSRLIMDQLAPLGPVYQAGTLSGNPLAVAAALATLEVLAQPEIYQRLETLSAQLEAGLKDAAARASVDLTINRCGSLLSPFFASGPVQNFEQVRRCDIPRFKRFFSAMLKQGIYLAPSAYEAMFVSAAHTDRDIEQTVCAAYNAFCKSAEN